MFKYPRRKRGQTNAVSPRKHKKIKGPLDKALERYIEKKKITKPKKTNKNKITQNQKLIQEFREEERVEKRKNEIASTRYSPELYGNPPKFREEKERK